jgi:hypothetical protein
MYARVQDPEQKLSISLDLMHHLAALHNLPRAFVAARFPAVERPIAELIAEEVALWNGLYVQTGTREPLIEFGLAWLRRNIPQVQEPALIVHGDVGPGNFTFEAGKVTAMLDWELAHLGDPMEDLAWLSMRTVLQPFPDFAACIREYEAAAGRQVDIPRLYYFRVLVQWRIAIIRHRKAGEDVANSLMSQTLNRRLLVEAIVALSGISIPAYRRVAVPPHANNALYDTALGFLREIIAPAITDSFALTKVKSVARIVKYLQQYANLSPELSRLELADLTELLAELPASVAVGQQELAERIRAGKIAERRLLEYFTRHVGRDTQLMENGLGAVAWHPFPAVR